MELETTRLIFWLAEPVNVSSMFWPAPPFVPPTVTPFATIG